MIFRKTSNKADALTQDNKGRALVRPEDDDVGPLTGLWKKQDKTIKALLFSLLVAGFIIVCCFMIIVQIALNRTIIVHFPPGVYASQEITAGSKGYMELWGKYFIWLVSEHSPMNIEDRANFLLRNSTAAGDKKIRPKLLEEYKRVKSNNEDQEFQVRENTWKTTWVTRELWRIEVEGAVKINSAVLGKSKDTQENRLYVVILSHTGSGVLLEDFWYEKR